MFTALYLARYRASLSIRQEMANVFLDFETYSEADLSVVGLSNYVAHKSTKILCAAVKKESDRTILLSEKDTNISELLSIIQADDIIIAHNAQFELQIWNRFFERKLQPENVYCTMAAALAMALPASLDKLAGALGVGHKLSEGQAMMHLLSKPFKPKKDSDITDWNYNDHGELYELLYSYCKQDVEITEGIFKQLRKLPQAEKDLWNLDYKINCRGIPIDLPAVKYALPVIEQRKKEIAANLSDITEGEITKPTQVARIKKFCGDRGYEIYDLGKQNLSDCLSKNDMPEDVRKVLQLRQMGSLSSISKITAMDNRHYNERITFAHQYHGATTGRWAGRGLQPQNFPRPKIEQEEIVKFFEEKKDSAKLDLISNSLRGFIKAGKGKEFIAVDYQNIEGRVLAWLAAEKWKVKAFADFDKGKGEDLYLLAAEKIYNVKIKDKSDHRRLIGKVSELALGYGGGPAAFAAMGKLYGVQVTEDEAEHIKKQWREANSNIVRYWYAVEQAALDALATKGEKAFIENGNANGKTYFIFKGKHLWCVLPSGRALCYPFASIDYALTPWGDKKALPHFRHTLGGYWVKGSTYGGSLVENITQAVARDLLVNGMFAAAKANLDICMHVHDEIVIEVAKENTLTADEFAAIITVLPGWAKGIPLSAKGWRGDRYKKD